MLTGSALMFGSEGLPQIRRPGSPKMKRVSPFLKKPRRINALGDSSRAGIGQPQKWKTPVGSGRFPVVNLGVVGVF